jgi:hypothetical protein
MGLAVHRLLDPDAVGLRDRVVLVGEQVEVEPLVVVELLDALDRVRDTPSTTAPAPS